MTRFLSAELQSDFRQKILEAGSLQDPSGPCGTSGEHSLVCLLLSVELKAVNPAGLYVPAAVAADIRSVSQLLCSAVILHQLTATRKTS